MKFLLIAILSLATIGCGSFDKDGNVTYTIDSNGSGMTYQWYLNGVAIRPHHQPAAAPDPEKDDGRLLGVVPAPYQPPIESDPEED